MPVDARFMHQEHDACIKGWPGMKPAEAGGVPTEPAAACFGPCSLMAAGGRAGTHLLHREHDIRPVVQRHDDEDGEERMVHVIKMEDWALRLAHLRRWGPSLGACGRVQGGEGPV